MDEDEDLKHKMIIVHIFSIEMQNYLGASTWTLNKVLFILPVIECCMCLRMQHEIFRDRRVPGSCLTLEYLTTLSITVFYFLYVSITIGFTTCRGDEISVNFQTYIFNTKKQIFFGLLCFF